MAAAWLRRDAEASRPVRRRRIRRCAAAAGNGLALLADFPARISVADQGGDGNDGAAGRTGRGAMWVESKPDLFISMCQPARLSDYAPLG